MVASWQLWAAGAAVFAALTALLAKLGLQGINPDMAMLLRTLVVALVMAPILMIGGQLKGFQLLQLPSAGLAALGLSGVATGISWMCYFRALQLGPVSRVAAIDKLSVVVVALLGVVLLGENLSALAWAGILLMAGGAVLVALT